MNFSPSFLDTVNKLIEAPRDYYKHNTNSYRHYIELNNSCKECGEIPIFAVPLYRKLLSIGKDVTLKYTINPKSIGESVSSGDTALKRLSKYGEITKCTVKNETIYGSKGIILDSNFKVLMVACVVGHFRDTGALLAKELRIYLSKKVFTDDSSIICKTLSKRVLPCLLANNVSLNSRRYMNVIPVDDNDNIIQSVPINIIIQDRDDLIITKRSSPKIKFSNERASDVLINYLDYTLESLSDEVYSRC